LTPQDSPRRLTPDHIVNLAISEIISTNLKIKPSRYSPLVCKKPLSQSPSKQTSPLKNFDEFIKIKNTRFSKIKTSRPPDYELKTDPELQRLMEEAQKVKSQLAQISREKAHLLPQIRVEIYP
jgi:hypothetical protein